LPGPNISSTSTSKMMISGACPIPNIHNLLPLAPAHGADTSYLHVTGSCQAPGGTTRQRVTRDERHSAWCMTGRRV
jgi:hypothetical protein